MAEENRGSTAADAIVAAVAAEDLDVWTMGASEDRRKCRRGKGTKFVVISLISTLSRPSKRMEAVRLVRACYVRGLRF